MSMFNQIARITDNLLLSSAHGVTKDRISIYGVTTIVNATLEVQSPKMDGVEVIRVQLEDVPHSNLGRYFDRISDKIHETAKRGGKTLVHCVAGVSRSASLCIAYLIKYHKMSLRQAYHHVKSKRPFIRPNVGFFRQLIEYEKKVLGRNSVNMINSGCGPLPDVYKDETKNMVYVTTYAASYGR